MYPLLAKLGVFGVARCPAIKLAVMFAMYTDSSNSEMGCAANLMMQHTDVLVRKCEEAGSEFGPQPGPQESVRNRCWVCFELLHALSSSWLPCWTHIQAPATVRWGVLPTSWHRTLMMSRPKGGGWV